MADLAITVRYLLSLLEEAYPYVDYAAHDWNEWASEEDNRRQQQIATGLKVRIGAALDGAQFDGQREAE